MRNPCSSFLFLAVALVAVSRVTSYAESSQSTNERQIIGQVRLNGQPAPAGVPVVLQIVSSRYATPAHEAEVAHTATGSKGEFSFSNLETIGANAGREFFAVSAKTAGYAPGFQVVDLTIVPRGQVDLELSKEAAQGESDSVAAVSSEKPRHSSNPEAEQALARAQDLLFRKHDPEGSIPEFKKAVRSDPWYGPGYMLLGLACMQTQRWSDAQWAFAEASKVEPGNAKAFLGLGSAENEQHKYADAQKALEHSLELAPESAEGHYELGRTLAALGKWVAAEPHARRAIEINPDYAGPHVLMGNIYLEQQDPDFALAEFREYLRLDPQGSLAPSVKQLVSKLEKAVAQTHKK